MHMQDHSRFTRRDFITSTSALSAASLLGISSRAAADPPLETTTVRLAKWPVSCIAPQFVAEALLRAEGFTDVRYVEGRYPEGGEPWLGFVGPGKADFDLETGETLMTCLDAGAPVRVLAGVHVRCYELFGSERVRSIRDLGGKAVPVDVLRGAKHVLLSSMAGYVGLDPNRDIDWIVIPSGEEAMDRFAAGKVDAFLGFPPEPQALRARGIHDVIVKTATDKPWSQYYCCMLFGHQDFVRRYPAATKRVVRAFLKGADLCARRPESAAREIVAKGYVQNYDFALETLRDVRYNVWRTYNPEDTLRFYGLRLHDVGMIKSTPQKLIAQGTDWRFLNELKKELKA
jgi:NitT/TauT family transport system substrate-binding protein